MEVLKNEEQQKKATFDPQKNYSWEEGTKVEVDAGFLNAIRTVLLQELNSPEAQSVLLKRELVGGLNTVVKDNVENGKFFEVATDESAEAEEVK